MYKLGFDDTSNVGEISLLEIYKCMVPCLTEFMILENYQAILSKKKSIPRGPVYYMINLAGEDDKLNLTLGRKSTSDIQIPH